MIHCFLGSCLNYVLTSVYEVRVRRAWLPNVLLKRGRIILDVCHQGILLSFVRNFFPLLTFSFMLTAAANRNCCKQKLLYLWWVDKGLSEIKKPRHLIATYCGKKTEEIIGDSLNPTSCLSLSTFLSCVSVLSRTVIQAC